MKNVATKAFLMSAALASTLAIPATPPVQDAKALYIIFDGLNSMWGELPDASRKIEIAKNVFEQLDPADFEGRDLALRLYGHRREGDCSDTELAVDFAPARASLASIAERVAAVTPRGKTPITRSLNAALEDFGTREGDILLISDGIETCDADPCDLVRSWRDDGIQIRVHVVGLGLTDMARGAMECIAETSGTTYHDANSAIDLSAAIERTAASEPPAPGDPSPAPRMPGASFRIAGQDAVGNFLPVAGTMTQSGQDPVEVGSNRRHVLAGGTYTLLAGVPIVSGGTYETVTQTVEVADVGETRLTVTLPRPPRVETRFKAGSDEVRGPMTYAFRDDEELFGLRPGEEYFINPGTYEFRAKLNQDNELTLTETIAAGEDKVLLFEAVETVHAKFIVTPEGSDVTLRQHQELHRNGELLYKVHYANGARVRPGIYTLRSDHPLTPYALEAVEITSEPAQTLSLSVPLGLARLSYRFNSEPTTNDRRCWLERIDASGARLERSAAQRCDGSDIYLSAGRYRVRTWDRLGTFAEIVFDAVAGSTVAVDIAQK